MSNRGGGRSDGKGGSSGNAPPPAPSPSDANKQSQPGAQQGAAQAAAAEQQPAAVATAPKEGDGSSGNAPPPAPSPSDAAADASAQRGPPTEPPAAQPAGNASRAARLKAAGYTRPSLKEFVEAGYEAANYESYFDKHEAGLEAKLDERAAAAKLEPPQPGWIRCRALKTALVRGMVKGPGEVFWLSEEEALRAMDKGSAEPV